VTTHNKVINSGAPNYASVRIPVPSQLNISEWRQLLHDYPDVLLCDFLEFGWPIGYVSAPPKLFDVRTHKGALCYPNDVSAYLQSEIGCGRVSGPFASSPFESRDLVLSPLNTVSKRDTTERRVIVDLSWPCGSSVNDGIPSDTYLGIPIRLTYPTVDMIAASVVAQGRGCLLFKRDLRKAFRQLPVCPGDYYLLGYTWRDKYYFDTVLTMGLRTAAMACQRTTNAVSWILQQQGHTVFNYLDDFIGVASPESASRAFNDLASTLTRLGLEESSSKSCSPSTKMVCLGVEFDTDQFTLSVSVERLRDIDILLDNWLTRKSCTRKSLQSLIGKLIFVSKCVRQSRIFISRMLDLLRTAKHNHHHITLSAEFRKDLAWWKSFLHSYNGVSMINTACWSTPGAIFVTDACLQGCGGVSGSYYFHSAFPSFITSLDLPINSLELLTIVVAAKLWGSDWKGLRILARCDNLVAVTVINTGRSRDRFLNSCLRELCYLAATFEFELRAVHLPGHANRACDLLSRWSQDDRAASTFYREFAVSGLHEVRVPDSYFQLNYHL